MSEQPEALRLADALEQKAIQGTGSALELAAAAELRRLHDLLGKANALNRIRGERIAALEQAGRQALEALEYYQSKSSVQMFDAAITALRQTLGDKHD